MHYWIIVSLIEPNYVYISSLCMCIGWCFFYIVVWANFHLACLFSTCWHALCMRWSVSSFWLNTAGIMRFGDEQNTIRFMPLNLPLQIAPNYVLEKRFNEMPQITWLCNDMSISMHNKLCLRWLRHKLWLMNNLSVRLNVQWSVWHN